MPPDFFSRWHPCLRAGGLRGQAAAWLCAGTLLLGCASHAPAPAPAPTASLPPMTAPSPVPPPLPQPPAPPVAPPGNGEPALAVTTMLAHADRLRTLTLPELAQEVARLSDLPASPARQTQLALALLQTQAPADGLRAQALLQRVLAQETPEAQALHPLVRLIAAQSLAQRRAEEQAERQAQQLRDAQRRIDQLNDRLEALRAIERSMPARPARPARPAP